MREVCDALLHSVEMFRHFFGRAFKRHSLNGLMSRALCTDSYTILV